MKLNAVRWLSSPRASIPLRASLDARKESDLLALRDLRVPSVYVVQKSDSKRIEALGPRVVSVDKKDKRKELYRSLGTIDEDDIGLIESSYQSVGRLKQGVQSFIARMLKAHKRGTFFIAVEDKLFDKLWIESEDDYDDVQRAMRRPRTARLRPGSLQETTAASVAILEDTFEDQSPDQLARQYVGTSDAARLVRQLIVKAAGNKTTVLIQGDTGTGKEVVARRIHKLSKRKLNPFCAVNCAAIPGDLLQSELFGHVKGAFTSAHADKKGLWVAAKGGTLFLDEIGDLADKHQAMLLRALEENRVLPVGATEEVAVDARIIAATNLDLYAMVRAKRFREDLYYRLRQSVIFTPSLRQIPEDIPDIAQCVWSEIADRSSDGLLDIEVLDLLKRHSWPGNARDLKAFFTMLYSWFPGDPPTVERAEMVLRYMRMRPFDEPVSTYEGPQDFHLVECMRHLRDTDGAVQATRVTLEALAHDPDLDAEEIKDLAIALTDRSLELKTLCAKTLLFHSPLTNDIVHQFAGKIAYLQGLLDDDIVQARDYCQREIQPQFPIVVATLFEESKRIEVEFNHNGTATPYHWATPQTNQFRIDDMPDFD